MNRTMTYRPLPGYAGALAAPRIVASWRPRAAESALERSRVSAWETEGGSLGPDSNLPGNLKAPVEILAEPRLSWKTRRAFRQGPQGSR